MRNFFVLRPLSTPSCIPLSDCGHQERCVAKSLQKSVKKKKKDVIINFDGKEVTIGGQIAVSSAALHQSVDASLLVMTAVAALGLVPSLKRSW